MKTSTLFFRAALLAALCATCAPHGFAAAPERPKAAFKVLFSNDTTNITSCKAPWKDDRREMTEDYIRASVDELKDSGIDVHMLQPGMGWVPWWPSKVLPMEKHTAWKKSQGLRVDGWYEQQVLNGLDIAAIFVEQCRKAGQHPFFSFRMNDQHHIYGNDKLEPEEFEKKAGVYQFYKENPQWRIGADGGMGRVGALSMNFAVPEVRNYRLMQIKELIENYDIDGFELDFMRHIEMFNQKDTTSEQREEILISIVQEVRDALDAKGKKAGRYLYLSVRIPAYPEVYSRYGINLEKLAAVPVDIVNASGHYFTDMQMKIAEMRAALPEHVAVYEELQFTNAIGAPVKDDKGKIISWPARRVTDLQQATAAYLAYKRGADGLSAFNYHYYRGTYSQSDVAGTPHEPPFKLFNQLTDMAWLEKQPQHYVAAFIWNTPGIETRPFQKAIKKGENTQIQMDMTPPKGGWTKDGKLRIQGRESLGKTKWRARVNEQELAPAKDVKDIFPNPYDVALGQPEDYRAWVVPAAILKDGVNKVDLYLESGADEAHIFYMDIELP